MLPITQYLLSLTQTDDIAKAEQILVGMLVNHHDTERAQELAARMFSSRYMPVFFVTEMPAWLGVSEDEFSEVYSRHMLYLRKNHPELFPETEATKQGHNNFGQYNRMSPESENAFYITFPELFRGRSKPNTESSMCYGIECPEKWFDLLWQHCLELERLAEAEGRRRESEDWPEIVQIKEKLGSLRCHLRNASEAMYALRDKLTLESYTGQYP